LFKLVTTPVDRVLFEPDKGRIAALVKFVHTPDAVLLKDPAVKLSTTTVPAIAEPATATAAAIPTIEEMKVMFRI
jgi:hypothetical protein